MTNTREIETTDVLVVGGGPVGCLIAYQLEKFKCKTITIEKEDKPSIPIYGASLSSLTSETTPRFSHDTTVPIPFVDGIVTSHASTLVKPGGGGGADPTSYTSSITPDTGSTAISEDGYALESFVLQMGRVAGRATTLWCRSLELLDQLDLCEPLMNDGIITRDGINYRNGLSVPGGMPFGQKMYKHGDTRFNFSLHLRQRLIERAFESALDDYDAFPRHRHELVSYTVASEEEGRQYPVQAVIRDIPTGEVYTVQAKAIVGADGAHSPVRKGAEIAFLGERSANKWIRIDALVETDMPSPRTLNSVQSESHGLVLWCPIDEGKVRIGYVFNASLQEKYGEAGVTGEVVMQEAKKALAPFNLEFKSLDWFTCYGIGQCMAETFVKGRVVLAGDSCHTHSSGSAQGLNTGIFDATNLAWKLALFLRGAANKNLLETYNEERYLGVNQVIENDKIISTLISGHLPPKFKDRKEHPRDILDEWFNNAETIAFTLGLGVQYPKNNLLNDGTVGTLIANVHAGSRGPEAFVHRLGTNEPVALQRLLLNQGSFYVVIFTGAPHLTKSSLEILRQHFDLPSGQTMTTMFAKNLVKTLTIVGAGGVAGNEILGMRTFGKTFYDASLEAHQRYGISPAAGGVVVFRPDGFIAKVAALQDAEGLVQHFKRFLNPVVPTTKVTNGINGSS